MEDQTIAKTIYAQIGNQAFQMLGAINFISDKNSLKFKIRGSKKFNYIKIALNSLDLYDMTFYKVWGNKVTTLEVNGLYDDMLHKTIERHTELYTKLF